MSIFYRRPKSEAPEIEQRPRGQSAPRPTLEQEVARIYRAGQQVPTEKTGVFGRQTHKARIGKEQVREAYQILQTYKAGKANLESRIIENEQWYKLRHWECMPDRKSEIEPASGWLFNAIANKHADAMDNFPAPNILPREEGDKAEAEKLSSILPVILDQCGFEQVYSDVWTYKLKSGTGVYGVFWDPEKNGGTGDIAIRKIDLLNLFWEPGIANIQDSQNVFLVKLVNNDLLKNRYPDISDKLGGDSAPVQKYIYDDTVDTSDKSAVIDWYYKRTVGKKTVLHYCKFVGDHVIFATENNPKYAERGWYDHGEYPFIFDTLFTVEGSPAGFGFIDIGKNTQAYIDRANKAILENLIVNATPRTWVREDSGINEAEYADFKKPIVHYTGDLNGITPMQHNELNGNYLTVLQSKIDELKEITGNRDISTGGTSSGVTAASAIAAMQEAGSKLSRDNIKASYRAFRGIVVQMIELIRQFYDVSRCFRIVGEKGIEQFVQYSNRNIAPAPQGEVFGVDTGYRVPMFDIEVTVQKASPYSKMSQNELALQFYGAGFFAPQNCDSALACLDMMDFDRKNFIMQKIEANGTMLQQIKAMQGEMMMLAQMVDQTRGSNIAARLAARFSGGAPVAPIDGRPPEASDTEALGGEGGAGEAETTKKARQRVADSTAPV